MIQVHFETTPAGFHAFHQFGRCLGRELTPNPGARLRSSCHARFAALWQYIRRQTTRVTVPSHRGSIVGARQAPLDGIGAREQSANHTFVTAWTECLRWTALRLELL